MADPGGDTRVHEFAVQPEQAGHRLDRVLAAVLPQHSRAQLQRLVKDGRVTVDGRAITKASQPVAEACVLRVDVPEPAPATPQPEPLPLAVVYEDADLVVLDKAAGMVVHPAAGHASGTLVNALLHHVADLSGVGGERRPGIVHRLDRGTSGLMVVAKHDEAHHALSRQFAGRSVEKEYVALVWGAVAAPLTLDAPIGRDPRHRKRMAARSPRGRPASTFVVTAARSTGVSLLTIRIATGRTHQIRVHLADAGHPVVGDELYGGVRRQVAPELRALAGLGRPFLHARRLRFVHPRDGRPLEFVAPLPPDLLAVLAALQPAVPTTPAAQP